MGSPAEARSILGHLINVSTPYSYETPDWTLICQGVESLSEGFEPETDDIQYICENTTTRIIKSYTISFELELRYIKNSKLQNWYNNFVRVLPTGSATEIDYIRFNKDEPMYGVSNQYIGVRRKATAYPTSIGGDASDPLTCGLTVSGTGEGEIGYVTFSTSDGRTTYSWTPANTSIPYVTSIGDVTMPNFYDGATVSEKSGSEGVVTVVGKGVNGATISVLKSDGTADTTTATVANGSWTLDVTLENMATSGDFYTIAFKQTSGTLSSVSTMSYTFKVAS